MPRIFSRNTPGSRRTLVLVALCVLAIVVVVLVMVWSPWQHSTKKNTAVTSKPPEVAVVEITPSGFMPSTLNVQPNTDIVWVNEDVNPHLPAADPYPTHASMPSLVAPRALGQKETYSFKVTKPETINYHDDINPTEVGTIVVR